MDQMNSTDYGYTPEQIKEMQEAFRKNDITLAASLEPMNDMPKEKARVFNKVKYLLSQYWFCNLKELGIKRLMRNFSKAYPIKLLQNVDGDFFSRQVADIFSDPEQIKKGVEQFFEMYEKPICAGLEGYASSIGKDVESLTDDEIHYVIDKVADVINEELLKVLMLGQQVPMIYRLSTANPDIQDFNTSISRNPDYINYKNKWTHCKTKIGAPILFSEIPEKEGEYTEGIRDFFSKLNSCDRKEYEDLREAFLETLDSIEREIFYLREDGYTQAEIAEKLGYKTHSAVTKRLKTMRKKWDDLLHQI